eukprot:1138994-Pelagomonas_calceolata.AAC.1
MLVLLVLLLPSLISQQDQTQTAASNRFLILTDFFLLLESRLPHRAKRTYLGHAFCLFVKVRQVYMRLQGQLSGDTERPAEEYVPALMKDRETHCFKELCVPEDKRRVNVDLVGLWHAISWTAGISHLKHHPQEKKTKPTQAVKILPASIKEKRIPRAKAPPLKLAGTFYNPFTMDSFLSLDNQKRSPSTRN